MRDMGRNSVIGIALVVLGAVALLANTGILAGVGPVVGALLFAAVGVLFVRIYARRDQEWALPTAFLFFGLGAAALIDGDMSGPYFLALLGVGFLLLFALERTHWWAIIPGGTLVSLGVVAAIDEVAPRLDAGPVLFLGLALTFLAVWAVGQRWAIWPAIGLGAVALFAMATVSGWVFPVLLILAGLFLLYRQQTR